MAKFLVPVAQWLSPFPLMWFPDPTCKVAKRKLPAWGIDIDIDFESIPSIFQKLFLALHTQMLMVSGTLYGVLEIELG